MVVSPDHRSPCLNIHPLPQWEELEEKIGQLPGPQQSVLRRFVIGRAQECEMDGNGRILLNQELCEHAGLEKGAVMAGVGNRLELWQEDAWQAVSQKEELSTEDLELLQDVYL